eukprot:1990210-Lingulodinium_polyedra.AAC.1
MLGAGLSQAAKGASPVGAREPGLGAMPMLGGPVVQTSLRLASARRLGRQSGNTFSVEGAAGFAP